MLAGAYSNYYQSLQQRQIENLKELTNGTRSANNPVGKNYRLSQETNKRRRMLAQKRKMESMQEEKRRQDILAQRRLQQQEATQKFQKAPLYQRCRSARSSHCTAVPSLEEALHVVRNSSVPLRQKSATLPSYQVTRRQSSGSVYVVADKNKPVGKTHNILNSLRLKTKRVRPISSQGLQSKNVHNFSSNQNLFECQLWHQQQNMLEPQQQQQEQQKVLHSFNDAIAKEVESDRNIQEVDEDLDSASLSSLDSLEAKTTDGKNNFLIVKKLNVEPDVYSARKQINSLTTKSDVGASVRGLGIKPAVLEDKTKILPDNSSGQAEHSQLVMEPEYTLTYKNGEPARNMIYIPVESQHSNTILYPSDEECCQDEDEVLPSARKTAWIAPSPAVKGDDMQGNLTYYKSAPPSLDSQSVPTVQVISKDVDFNSCSPGIIVSSPPVFPKSVAIVNAQLSTVNFNSSKATSVSTGCNYSNETLSNLKSTDNYSLASLRNFAGDDVPADKVNDWDTALFKSLSHKILFKNGVPPDGGNSITPAVKNGNIFSLDVDNIRNTLMDEKNTAITNNAESSKDDVPSKDVKDLQSHAVEACAPNGEMNKESALSKAEKSRDQKKFSGKPTTVRLIKGILKTSSKIPMKTTDRNNAVGKFQKVFNVRDSLEITRININSHECSEDTEKTLKKRVHFADMKIEVDIDDVGSDATVSSKDGKNGISVEKMSQGKQVTTTSDMADGTHIAKCTMFASKTGESAKAFCTRRISVFPEEAMQQHQVGGRPSAKAHIITQSSSTKDTAIVKPEKQSDKIESHSEKKGEMIMSNVFSEKVPTNKPVVKNSDVHYISMATLHNFSTNYSTSKTKLEQDSSESPDKNFTLQKSANNKVGNQVFSENGLKMDHTPTDEEINWLWKKVQLCLSQRSQNSDKSCSGSLKTQEHGGSFHQRSMVTNKYIDGNILGQSCCKVGKMKGFSGSVMSADMPNNYAKRLALLQQRHLNQKGFKSANPQLKHQTFVPSIADCKETLSKMPSQPSVTESLLTFLTAEELSKHSMSDSQIHRVMGESHARYPFYNYMPISKLPTQSATVRPQLKAVVSALSIEEQKLMESLEKLNEKLKISEQKYETGLLNPNQLGTINSAKKSSVCYLRPFDASAHQLRSASGTALQRRRAYFR